MTDTNSAAVVPVGIDLGTTFSAIAHLDSDGRPSTIRNSEGELTTPSVIFFDRSGPVVGHEAIEAGIAEPDRLAQFVKRDIGEPSYEKAIRGEELPAEVVLSLVLAKLRDDAQLKLGTINSAVVTVPAFYNEPCRKATMDAGRIAGLEVLDIINEPTAAAISYGVEQGFLSPTGESHRKEVVLVFDLGGGTFDVTIMEIDGSKYTAIASAGDVYLGGADWDMRIVDHVAENFESEFGVDPRTDPSAAQELLQKANHAKHSLTARDEITIYFSHQGERLKLPFSRSTFEEMTRDLLDRTQLTLESVLREAAMEWSDLTRVLLVGGSTRMPAVAQKLEALSGIPVDRSLSPDEAVAHGAAIYAGLVLKAGGKRLAGMSVTNVSSHILGVLGKENATGRSRRGVMIPRNTALPARKTRKFTTARDNQPSVKVEVVEGGDDGGNNATKIGTCVVTDLPPNLPKRTPIEVTFEYASNGRLRIAASLPTVGKQAALALNRSAGLTELEVEKWQQRVREGFGDESGPTKSEKSTGVKKTRVVAPVESIEPAKAIVPQVRPVPQVEEPKKAKPKAVKQKPVKQDEVTSKPAKPIRKLGVADEVPVKIETRSTAKAKPQKQKAPDAGSAVPHENSTSQTETPAADDWRSRSKKLTGQ